MASLDPVDQSYHRGMDIPGSEGKVFLLRHASPKIDPSVPTEDWPLSKKGWEQAKNLVNDSRLQNVDIIFSSPELRAVQTISPLAKALRVDVIEIDDLREAHLDQYYTRESFNSIKISKFLDENLEIGESHHDAKRRMIDTVEGIRSYARGRQVVIVSHGTVISLYLSHLYSMNHEQTLDLWYKMPYLYLEEL